ncbi:MAG: hypothetical protein EXR77_03695 [Myxococcales bacterium]|nr:hypothetical protein [Myxococcales bacterium]
MKGAVAQWMAILAAVGAAAALVQVLRALLAILGRQPVAAAEEATAQEPLLAEQRRLVNHLRELDFDLQTGKISQADYAQLRDRYETAALAIADQLASGGQAAASASN